MNFPILRYLLVGGWNTLFGMGIYALLYRLSGHRVHYLVLLIPANILAITNAFLGYKLIVFRTRGNIAREYIRCYVVYGIMMVLGAGLLFVCVEHLKFNPVYANAFCVLVTTTVSYFSHKYFSFAAPSVRGQKIDEDICPHRATAAAELGRLH